MYPKTRSICFLCGHAEPAPPRPPSTLATAGVEQSLPEIAGGDEKPDLTSRCKEQIPEDVRVDRFQCGMLSAFSTHLRTLNFFSLAPI